MKAMQRKALTAEGNTGVQMMHHEAVEATVHAFATQYWQCGRLTRRTATECIGEMYSGGTSRATGGTSRATCSSSQRRP